MNEHLDKLAGRAFYECNVHEDPDSRGALGVFAQIFARLVVNDCIEALGDQVDEKSAEGLRKRFGVD